MKTFSENYYDKSYFEKRYFMFTWERAKDEAFRRADEIIKVLKPRTILEVGCAVGYLQRALEERGVKTWGCDISDFALSQNPYKTKVCDIRDGLPYEDSFVDVIVSESTFEHIEMEYIPKLMREVYRVADRGFFLIVPVSLHTFNSPWGDPSHVTYMNPSYWISEAYKAGFSLDIRRSRQMSRGVFQNAHLAFFKGDLFSI